MMIYALICSESTISFSKNLKMKIMHIFENIQDIILENKPSRLPALPFIQISLISY